MSSRPARVSRRIDAAPAAPATPGARGALLTVCLLLVTHGSLYPWHFESPPSVVDALAALFAGAGLWTSLGDVAGNVVLFVPVGAMALGRHRRDGGAPIGVRASFALAWGVAFAMLLQVLQIWVPARSAAISDVVWNAVGMAIGLAAAALLARRVPGGLSHTLAAQSAGVLLIGLWLVIEWWPFLPTIDWQQIKNALKPLVLQRPFHLRSFVEVSLATAIMAQPLRGMRRRGLWLLALLGAALAGKLFIAGQILSLSHAAGWIVGGGAGVALWRAGNRTANLVVLSAALGWFTIDELRPYTLADAAQPFTWMPFVASLRGSLLTNTLALVWLFFWLGAAMVGVRAIGGRVGGFAVVLGLWALGLEALQTWLPGRVADITPALLPALWWLILRALPDEQRVSAPPALQTAPR